MGLSSLPPPTVSRETRQYGTGHIVLSTDYRLVRMSPNTLLWLGLSHTMSLSASGSALGSVYGRPLVSFVADEDKDLVNEFLTDLFMERRNAERLKLHSVAEGGDGSARGVCESLDDLRTSHVKHCTHLSVFRIISRSHYRQLQCRLWPI